MNTDKLICPHCNQFVLPKRLPENFYVGDPNIYSICPQCRWIGTQDWWNSAKEPPIKSATKSGTPHFAREDMPLTTESLLNSYKDSSTQYKLDVKATPYSKQEPLNQTIQQEKSFWNGVALWLGTGAAICGLLVALEPRIEKLVDKCRATRIKAVPQYMKDDAFKLEAWISDKTWIDTSNRIYYTGFIMGGLFAYTNEHYLGFYSDRIVVLEEINPIRINSKWGNYMPSITNTTATIDNWLNNLSTNYTK